MLIGIPLVGGLGGLIGYLVMKKRFESLASGALFGKPVALLGIAVAGAVLPALFLLKGVVPLVFMTCPTARVPLLLAVAILGGTWTTMLCNYSRHRLQETPESFPLEMTLGTAPLQIWFQDLLLAMVCFGFGAMLVNILVTASAQSPHMMLWALLYLFVAGSFGMFVAADVSRRSAWGQSALMRAGIFVTIFFLFPLCLPLATVAWWLWRGALRKSAQA